MKTLALDTKYQALAVELARTDCALNGRNFTSVFLINKMVKLWEQPRARGLVFFLVSELVDWSNESASMYREPALCLSPGKTLTVKQRWIKHFFWPQGTYNLVEKQDPVKVKQYEGEKRQKLWHGNLWDGDSALWVHGMWDFIWSMKAKAECEGMAGSGPATTMSCKVCLCFI